MRSREFMDMVTDFAAMELGSLSTEERALVCREVVGEELNPLELFILCDLRVKNECVAKFAVKVLRRRHEWQRRKYHAPLAHLAPEDARIICKAYKSVGPLDDAEHVRLDILRRADPHVVDYINRALREESKSVVT